MQDETISTQINSYGGISFVIAKMNKLGIPQLFDSILGARPKQSTYSNSDAFLSWMYCNLCGAKRLEDINTENLYAIFKQIPIVKLCSPDQVARVLKKFQTMPEKHSKGAEHVFNRNRLLNDLLLQFSKALGLLREDEPYLLDYDGTTVPVEKHDSKPTYKGFRGYSPAVMFIGKIPVSIEARNGNTSANYKIKEALQDMYGVLRANKIQTWGIRMDAASYQEDVIKDLHEMGQKFYIRVANNENIMPDIQLADWKQIEIHKRVEEIGDVEFFPYRHGPKFRFVITRFVNAAPAEHRRKEIIYRAIITNDMEKVKQPDGTEIYKRSALDVVRLYDQRGDSENNFRDLLNDFNWKRLPFSFMNENLVFMYVSSMAKCLYEYVIRESSQLSPALDGSFKLKKFVAYFIKRVSVLWTKEGDGWNFSLLTLKDKFDALRSWAIRK